MGPAADMADPDPRYPRSSIEDDFNYGSCVASASLHIRMGRWRPAAPQACAGAGRAPRRPPCPLCPPGRREDGCGERLSGRQEGTGQEVRFVLEVKCGLWSLCASGGRPPALLGSRSFCLRGARRELREGAAAPIHPEAWAGPGSFPSQDFMSQILVQFLRTTVAFLPG